MAETYINEQRQARLYAQDFLAANPTQHRVTIDHGGVRLTLDRAGSESVNRSCQGCANDIPGSCAAQFPEEPCYQAKEAA